MSAAESTAGAASRGEAVQDHLPAPDGDRQGPTGTDTPLAAAEGVRAAMQPKVAEGSCKLFQATIDGYQVHS